MNKQWRDKHKEHLNQYKKDWRKSKPQKQLQYAKNERESRKSQIYDYKRKCVKCGETRPYVLDFHHIENEIKEFTINSGNNKRYPIKQLELEIQKCVCLCRNCHAEFHYLYGNVPNNATEALCEYIGINPYCVTPSRKE